MKKFLKWSAAFLVLGVLAVGCIKNEPSQGIEAMRNAKAALLTAQAALEQAKVQVEAANAALIQAQASLLKAQEAIVAAQAKKILAEADLIQAEVEWQNALTDFHKEGWAIRIQEMEIELEVIRAEADAAIAEWELYMAQMQADMVAAQQAYEDALLAFQLWKLANVDTISQALMAALDGIVAQIQAVILDLAQAQIDLDVAKANYLWYVNIEYPQAVEVGLMHLEAEKKWVVCKIEHLTALAEAYEALYNAKHEEFDAIITNFQEMVIALRAEIVEMELLFLQLEEEYMLFDHNALAAANAALTKKRTVSINGVFSDGGDDPNIHVNNGTYRLAKWGWATTPSMFDVMKRDMRVIADTRAEFEDQDSGVIERNIAAKKTAADAAVKKYTDNWNLWQKYYNEARITGSHTGSRYVAWVNAWTAWDAQMASYRVHLNTYDDMYSTADSLIQLFMDYLDGWLDEGTLTVPGSANISEVLGGIEFNAGTLAQFIFQGNAAAVYNVINTIIGLINAPTQMDAIITQLKGIMDGTHPEGYPPFWEHATAWTYKPTPVVYGDIMRAVYANSNKEITQLTKQDWYVWMFLYWLFEDKQVELGLEPAIGGGPVIIINESDYQNAAEQVLFDFFGILDKTAYDAYMVGPDNKPILDAIKAYYDAVEGLGTLETAMFDPFDRVWKAYGKHKDFNGGVTGEVTRAMARDTYWSWKPFLVEIAPTPPKYNPPIYDDTLDLHEAQNRPVDANHFFFVLEGPDGLGRTTISPSLDFDVTYLDGDCNLWVSYAALLAAGEDCGDQWSQWAGDLPLWLWSEKGDRGSGHYFYAIYQARDYQAYLDTYNRVLNGEYEALIGKIQALYDAQMTAYKEAKAIRDALAAELQDIIDGLYDIGYDIVNDEPVYGYVEYYEDLIDEYEWMIGQASMAHDYGNWWYTGAEEGLLSMMEEANEMVLEHTQYLEQIEEAIALLNQGLPVEVYYDVIQDMSAMYQAQIDFILEDIENLQQKLVVLEGIRAKLLADYL